MYRESEALIQALERRPELVNGLRKPSSLKPSDLNRKWTEVSEDMKESGYHVKSVREIRKKWTDLKYRTRKKAMEVERNQKMAKGADGENTVLTPQEKRIMALLDGTTVKEIGGGSSNAVALTLYPSSFRLANEDEMFMPTIKSIKTIPKVEIVSDADESASDSSIDAGDSSDPSKNDGKDDARSCQEGKRKKRLPSQDYFAELLSLEKEKIQLMKEHNNLLSSTLNELKNLCHVIGKKNS